MFKFALSALSLLAVAMRRLQATVPVGYVPDGLLVVPGPAGRADSDADEPVPLGLSPCPSRPPPVYVAVPRTRSAIFGRGSPSTGRICWPVPAAANRPRPGRDARGVLVQPASGGRSTRPRKA